MLPSTGASYTIPALSIPECGMALIILLYITATGLLSASFSLICSPVSILIPLGCAVVSGTVVVSATVVVSLFSVIFFSLPLPKAKIHTATIAIRATAPAMPAMIFLFFSIF